jgi:predicted porin
MQKKLIALAVAGLVSGAAFAQSNVTVYGIADVYYGRATADGNKTTNVINGGGLSGSRIGFKGVEDLGNGLKALFTLEYGIANDSKDAGVGSGAAPARQQLVGLTGGFGTVVAGSAQTAGYDFACATSAYAGSGIDNYNKVGRQGATAPFNARTSFLLQCGQEGRASNAFAYISPSFGGATIAFNHARVTEAAGTFTTGKDAYANLLSAQYAGGPIAVNGTYAKVSMAHTDASDDVVEYGINGSYDLGVAKLFASYQTLDNKEIDNKNSKWGMSVTVPVGAIGLHAGYAKGRIKETSANDDPKSWTLAATYGFSKRTTGYAGYNRVSNSADGALPSVIAPNAGGKSSVFVAGVRHSF